MNFDDLETTWRNQDTTQQIAVDEQALRRLVERERLTLERAFFLRDAKEIGAAAVMLPIWIWMGVGMDLPWTWYLTIPVLLWIAGFLLVERKKRRLRQVALGAPLRESVTASLAQVEHQIRLLTSIFWWYLLPPTITIACFLLHSGWLTGTLWMSGFMVIFVILLYWWVFELNQKNVRRELLPRREELVQFLESLGEPTPTQPS